MTSGEAQLAVRPANQYPSLAFAYGVIKKLKALLIYIPPDLGRK
jgi:hypothetical protein